MKITLCPTDYVVIAVYVTALIGVGMWVSWRRRESTDLFLAGRSLGWPTVGLSIFGTNVSPSFMIAACGVAYTTGMVTANFEWLAWWFLMLLAMLFVPYYLGTGISTMPQFLKRRFGNSAHEFLSWYTLFTTIVLWLGGTLYASGLLLEQVMGWPLWLSVLVLTVIATSFTVAGGLAAVVITDSFQVVLMLVGATALTVIALTQAGGVPALLDNIPADHWRLIRPAGDAEYPWPAMLLGYPVLGIWFWCTDQTIVQRALGARSIRQGQLGAVFAGYLKIFTPLIFMLPGILCVILHPGIKNPDHVFMTMVNEHLGPRSIGFSGAVGLIVAVLLAALISTVDSGLNSFSTVFTLDIYVRKFRPRATLGETKWVGRAATVAAAAIGVLCALGFQQLGKNLFDLLQGVIAFVAPPMSAVFLIGVLWKRATAKAAVTSLVLGAIVSLSVGVCCMTDWPKCDNGFWPHYLLVSFYLFAAICAFMVVVSLATRKSPAEEELPTLKEMYAAHGTRTGLVWGLWGLLAAIMLAIYVGFQWLSQ